MTNLSWKVRSIFNMHKVWRSWLFRNFSVTFIKSLNLSSIKPYLIVHQVAMWTLLYLVSEGFSFLVTRVWNFGKFIRHSLWRGRDLKTELKTHVAPISAQVENSSFLRFDTWKLRHLTFSTEQNFSDFSLIKILSYGLPNELQNTRGRQSKNLLSHSRSTWSKNVRNVFFDIFCNLSVSKRKIGPPK